MRMVWRCCSDSPKLEPPLAWMGQQDDRGPPGGMAAGCLLTLALDADTATMAGREQ